MNKNLHKLITNKLNRFINARKDRFPNVSESQKEKWIKSIYKQVNAQFDDNDIFYDFKPEDVVEM